MENGCFPAAVLEWDSVDQKFWFDSGTQSGTTRKTTKIGWRGRLHVRPNSQSVVSAGGSGFCLNKPPEFENEFMQPLETEKIE